MALLVFVNFSVHMETFREKQASCFLSGNSFSWHQSQSELSAAEFLHPRLLLALNDLWLTDNHKPTNL